MKKYDDFYKRDLVAWEQPRSLRLAIIKFVVQAGQVLTRPRVRFVAQTRFNPECISRHGEDHTMRGNIKRNEMQHRSSFYSVGPLIKGLTLSISDEVQILPYSVW